MPALTLFPTKLIRSIVITLASCTVFCSPLDMMEREVSIEENVASCGIVFRGNTFLDESGGSESSGEERVTAHFYVVNTYKGATAINDLVANNLGHLNVTFPSWEKKKRNLETPKEYIIFCNLIKGEVKGVAAVKWTENNDLRVWSALGWSKWSDWSSCSVSCSAGIQQRTRHCKKISCHGYNVEQRHCNLFGCEDIINPLSSYRNGEDGHKSFHPSMEKWQRLPDRPTAWRLYPDSYIWLPAKEIFQQNKNQAFPKEFSVFLTVRIINCSLGTIFSLRSRSRQDTYLSLELTSLAAASLESVQSGESGELKLIHASSLNGTDVVRIPAPLDDGHWHQLALSIRDQSVVEVYVDCIWSKTEILRFHSLDLPDDSDLIIGYLFTGDLEQLSISPDPRAASLQCEDKTVTITDFQEIINRFSFKRKTTPKGNHV
ncbi:uncharacterized protein LOC114337317 [Diabrotica virgifera virgifera]|uniref:Thrombospondin-like N-terminal domain-containing protein n=1 Tax=Diabrotica virgifera virgifera TaxID=50390 RepID=A0ABM5JU67_DIAVI|nr:uncharacterized protein LOC114337317 [Diabrotica virgifera virgifera]